MVVKKSNKVDRIIGKNIRDLPVNGNAKLIRYTCNESTTQRDILRALLLNN